MIQISNSSFCSCVTQQQHGKQNLDSRLEQLEEQGKTMADATRRLLETVNAVKETGELLLQMIENHQKMLEMSGRVENLINDVKSDRKVETISDEEEDWGDNSPPHLILLHTSEKDNYG